MSQHAKILKALKENKKFGVPNYVFSNRMHILDYTARISELRKEGHNIKAERQVLSTGRKSNVFNYFLIEEDDKPVKPKTYKKHEVDGMKYELPKKNYTNPFKKLIKSRRNNA